MTLHACNTADQVFSQLNNERAIAGKGPIGFVNPVLYAHPEVLNDIVNGTNLGCSSDGFQAVPGYVFLHLRFQNAENIPLTMTRWDPVTGLGTPNYPKMKALFLSLP